MSEKLKKLSPGVPVAWGKVSKDSITQGFKELYLRQF